jgi:hypothetical protein
VRFEKLADTLHPADSEAFTWLMNAQEGDTIEVKVGSVPVSRTVHCINT